MVDSTLEQYDRSAGASSYEPKDCPFPTNRPTGGSSYTCISTECWCCATYPDLAKFVHIITIALDSLDASGFASNSAAPNTKFNSSA